MVLASRSSTRLALLTSAGLSAEVFTADIDERALEDQHLAQGGSIDGLAAELARAKALSASRLRPEAYCLAADQTLNLGERVFHKPRDQQEAFQSIAALAGRKHCLISAFCVVRFCKVLVVDWDKANLLVRDLDENGIAQYLERAGPKVFSSVGGYQLEGIGLHLFEGIDGDHATILGMPMLKLLAWLRRQGLIWI